MDTFCAASMVRTSRRHQEAPDAAERASANNTPGHPCCRTKLHSACLRSISVPNLATPSVIHCPGRGTCLENLKSRKTPSDGRIHDPTSANLTVIGAGESAKLGVMCSSRQQGLAAAAVYHMTKKSTTNRLVISFPPGHGKSRVVPAFLKTMFLANKAKYAKVLFANEE